MSFTLSSWFRCFDYAHADARLYYWRTNNRAEVDLVVELNGRIAFAVELKSRPSVSGVDLSGLRAFRDDWPEVLCLLICTAPASFSLDFAEVLPWREYLDRIAEQRRNCLFLMNRIFPPVIVAWTPSA